MDLKEPNLIIISDIEFAAAPIGMPMPYSLIAELDPDCDGSNEEFDITVGLQLGGGCFYIFLKPKNGAGRTIVYAIRMEQVVNGMVNGLMIERERAKSSQ